MENQSDNTIGEAPYSRVVKNEAADNTDETVSITEAYNDNDELLDSYYVSLPLPDGITWYKATFLIVNAALGAALLNFPQAFSQTGGIAGGNIIHLIFVGFALGSLLILAICAFEKNCKTYQEVVLTYCGPFWGVFCSVCISCYCFVTCITFLVIIGDQFDRAFASFHGSDFCHYWYMNRQFTITLSAIFLIIPCCLKRIDGLQGMSYVGVLAILYLVCIMVAEMESGSYDQGDILIWNVHILKMFNVVPVICFGYQCHVSCVPIFSCLKDSNRTKLVKAGLSAIFVCFCLYTVGANCGYITFGSYISGDILLSYDATKPEVLTALILLAVKSWTTYPILLFCIREAISDMYLLIRGFDYGDVLDFEPIRRKVIATILLIGTIFCALFIPNLDTVVKLLGSLAAMFIFVFPGMCYLQKTLDFKDLRDMPLTTKDFISLTVAMSYIVVGMFTLGLAFTLGVESSMRATSEISICI